MTKMENINPTSIFNISNERDFQELALKIFQKQYCDIPIYQLYCQMIQVDPEMVDSLNKIPFLPIEFFKTLTVWGPDGLKACMSAVFKCHHCLV